MGIKLVELTKIYKNADIETRALDHVSLDIEEGEIVVILGPSGSGKSTMLNVCSGLDSITSGQIYYNDTDISKYSDKQFTKFRRDNIGFIFQSYNLLPNLTVKENIEVGHKLAHDKIDLNKLLDAVEMSDQQRKFPYQLSGGQQQRVSIARALAKNPKVLFCDEPTGALDEVTGKKVLETLQKVNKEYKTTIFLITHNPGIAQMGHKVVKMNSGKIVEMKVNEHVVDACDISWA